MLTIISKWKWSSTLTVTVSAGARGSNHVHVPHVHTFTNYVRTQVQHARARGRRIADLDTHTHTHTHTHKNSDFLVVMICVGLAQARPNSIIILSRCVKADGPGQWSTLLLRQLMRIPCRRSYSLWRVCLVIFISRSLRTFLVFNTFIQLFTPHMSMENSISAIPKAINLKKY